MHLTTRSPSVITTTQSWMTGLLTRYTFLRSRPPSNREEHGPLWVHITCTRGSMSAITSICSTTYSKGSGASTAPSSQTGADATTLTRQSPMDLILSSALGPTALLWELPMVMMPTISQMPIFRDCVTVGRVRTCSTTRCAGCSGSISAQLCAATSLTVPFAVRNIMKRRAE